MSKVMIHIDGDANQRHMVSHLFERYAIQILGFDSMEEALPRLQNDKQLDIVVSEIPSTFDEQDDYVTALLDLTTKRGAKLILLTESQIPETLEAFRAKGIDGWFTKPAQRNRFYDTILRFLGLD